MSAARSLLAGLAELWRLDETSGTRKGLLGNFDLAPVGSGVSAVAGKIGSAVALDGASALQCLQMSAFSPQAGDGLAVPCWLKIDAVPGAGQFPRVVSLEGTLPAWLLYLNATGGVGFEVWSPSGTSFGPAESADLSLHTWHLIGGNYDRANVSLWVDGVQVGSAAYSGDIRRSLTPLQVGRSLDADNVTGLHYLTGAIDELLIAHRGLTTAEWAALWAGGPGDRLFARGRRLGLAPIASVTRTLDFPSSGAGVAVVESELRADAHLARLRTASSELVSDIQSSVLGQISRDDGHTWETPFALPGSLDEIPFSSGPGPTLYDPTSGLLVRQWEKQYVTGGRFITHTWWQTSSDQGRTWSALQPFTYEAGAAFDPNNPLNAAWLNNNQAAYGNNIWRKANGDLIVACGSARDPSDPAGTPDWMKGGLLFTGHWTGSTYTWTPSNLVSIPDNLSRRGLLEPVVAELLDGRIFIVWRIDNSDGGPSVKYCSTSTNGGATISSPVEFTFDTGGRMYSPSSSPYLWRSPKSGKLYFLGNVSADASANRYPLSVGEVDETLSPPAVKRDTLTVLDDRVVTQPSQIQLSNVALIETIDGRALEGRLTLYGGYAPGDLNRADHYLYRIGLTEPVSGISVDAAADYVILWRGTVAAGVAWDAVNRVFVVYDPARREDFALGVTAGLADLPLVGAGVFTLVPYTIPDPKLSPGAGDVALAAVGLTVAGVLAPVGSAAAGVGPAPSARLG